jgi:hypothetical protein
MTTETHACQESVDGSPSWRQKQQQNNAGVPVSKSKDAAIPMEATETVQAAGVNLKCSTPPAS